MREIPEDTHTSDAPGTPRPSTDVREMPEDTDTNTLMIQLGG